MLKSRLGLGTAQFGMKYGITNNKYKTAFHEAKKMVNFAFEHGIDTIDTAMGYEESEKTLGKIGISKFKVVTKIGSLNTNTNDIDNYVKNNVKNSMNTLNLKTIYSVLVHNSKDLINENANVIFKSLLKQKELGHINKIGVSVYCPNILLKIIENFEIDLVQLPINVLDKKFNSPYIFDTLKKKNIEIHVRSIFLQGLLLLEKRKISEYKVFYNILKEWHSWLEKNSQNALDTCLSYALNNNYVDRIIVGANNLNQLKKIIFSENKKIFKQFPKIKIDDNKLLNPSNW